MCTTKNFKKSVRHIEHEEEDEFTLGTVAGSETTDSDCIRVVHDKKICGMQELWPWENL